MRNILDKIVAHKRKEVAEWKAQVSIKTLEAAETFSRTCFSLQESIKNPEKSGIIAEFKRKSPSKDVINDTATVEEVTEAYTENGASGLSVLTDNYFFAGNTEDLEIARTLNAIPILRKDFVIDEYQIIEAKSIGADVILLIAECLSKEEIKRFTHVAKTLGLEVLLEMHSEEQLDKIGAENDMIGINNRDLTTFTVDIDRSIELSRQLPEEALRIAESGIHDPKVILKMKAAGFDGFLMGEHFMKEKKPGEALKRFIDLLK